MRFFRVNARVLAIGLVCAMAGLCFALATSESASAGRASSRAVGSAVTLRFTNPLVTGTTEFDLGDACFGTDTQIVRYVTAEGGLRPYRFTSNGAQSLQNVIEGTSSSLQLGLSGLIAGTAPFAVAPTSVTVLGTPGLRFNVTVQDSRGTNPGTITSFFNLFLVNCPPGTFRFAVDSLPTALLASSYAARVDVVGGTKPVTFRVVSVGGAVSLEALGLSLSSDGTLIGRPLTTGTFLLTLRAIDGANKVATNRAGTASDQTFALTIVDNPITSSDLVTTSCQIKGDSAEFGKDSLKFTGIINALGQDNFDLNNSDFAFRLGGIAFTGRLDERGQYRATLPDDSRVSVKVRGNSGAVDVKITKGTFGALLNASALLTGALTRKVVQVTVGDAVTSSEVLDFETEVDGSKFELNYMYGREGSAPAGAFQIVSVRGKDGFNSGGLPGDAWKVKFMAAARRGVISALGSQGLDNITAVTIRIGTNFIQPLLGIRSTGTNVSFGERSDGVRRFQLNSEKGTGTLQTGVIRTGLTNIPLASSSPGFGNIFFPLGIDLNRTGAPFSGEHARRVFGLKKNYKDAPPKR
jgi:hypothetical protein